MQLFSTAITWVAMLAVTVPLALMLLLVLPSGAPAQIAMHAILLVIGAAIVLAMRPDDEDPQ